mmetsp:Transcript_3226/g.4289  ORF Transcript_3226/g.4289 Transcript_3226/m.4289 type:complete len:113 (-) Transcript_3226:1413-1751(-)
MNSMLLVRIIGAELYIPNLRPPFSYRKPVNSMNDIDWNKTNVTLQQLQEESNTILVNTSSLIVPVERTNTFTLNEKTTSIVSRPMIILEPNGGDLLQVGDESQQEESAEPQH